MVSEGKNFPASREAVQGRLGEIAREMGEVLSSTALSLNLKEAHHFSCAIYTPKGLLVSASEGFPFHLGPLLQVAARVLERYPREQLEAKDVLITNDPSLTGSLLPDVCLLAPIFHRGRLLALLAALARYPDIGGCFPGSMCVSGTGAMREGLYIPPFKLLSRGRLNRVAYELITRNLFAKRDFRGNLEAQLAAIAHGAGKLAEAAERFGLHNLEHLMGETIDYTASVLKAALEAIPQGTYTFEDFLEGSDPQEGPLNIRVAITRKGKNLQVDFTGTHPQVRSPFNLTHALTLSCVYYALKALLVPDLPFNAGYAGAVKVITPPGTLVNPYLPAPLSCAGLTAQRVAGMLLEALAGVLSSPATAAGAGGMNTLIITWTDLPGGEPAFCLETLGGGTGAAGSRDGASGVHAYMTNARNIPVEALEEVYPLLVERCALAGDSGGAGNYRGGLGLIKEIRILRGTARVAVCLERSAGPPRGTHGGLPGKRAKLRVVSPDGREEEKRLGKGWFTFDAPAGTRIILQTAGGGGLGSPLERDPEMVRQDVLEGLVSRRAAEDIYGVVLTADMEVDAAKTARRRNELKAGLDAPGMI